MGKIDLEAIITTSLFTLQDLLHKNDLVKNSVCRRGNIPSQTRLAAWSRTDLFSTIAAGFVLMIISSVSLARVANNSSLLVCLRNMQTLAAAASLYSIDNQGLLVPNPDGSDSGVTATKPAWAGGWLDFTSSSDNTNVMLLQGSLNGFVGINGNYGGLLGLYVADPRTFKCPEDTSSVVIARQQFARVRSVSMNAYLSGVQTKNGNKLNTFVDPNFQVFMRKSDFGSINPAEIFQFIEERAESINDGVFNVETTKAIDQNGNLTPDTFTLIDLPGVYHENGTALSFVDGHSEFWTWKDPRTTRNLAPSSSYAGNNINSPSNSDVGRLAQATTRHK